MTVNALDYGALGLMLLLLIFIGGAVWKLAAAMIDHAKQCAIDKAETQAALAAGDKRFDQLDQGQQRIEQKLDSFINYHARRRWRTR